jgi:hypothetical protein
VLENACAITESELLGADPAVLAGGAIEQPDPPDGVRDFRPVRADVLHRCRARRARDARQAFEAAEAVLERGGHDVVPHRAGLGAQSVPVDVDTRIGQPHHRQVGYLVGQHHIGAAGQHQRPCSGVRAAVQGADDGDDRFGGLAGDQPARDRTDTQRGQRRERHLLGDRYTT